MRAAIKMPEEKKYNLHELKTEFGCNETTFSTSSRHPLWRAIKITDRDSSNSAIQKKADTLLRRAFAEAMDEVFPRRTKNKASFAALIGAATVIAPYLFIQQPGNSFIASLVEGISLFMLAGFTFADGTKMQNLREQTKENTTLGVIDDGDEQIYKNAQARIQKYIQNQYNSPQLLNAA